MCIRDRYTDLFLDCMAGRYEKALLLNNIQTELGRLRSSYQTSDLLELLHALAYLMQDKEEPALLLIEDASARVIDKRTEDPDAYCLYLYLKAEMDRSDCLLYTSILYMIIQRTSRTI